MWACSRKAREAGVKAGMTVAEASALSSVVSSQSHIELWSSEEDQMRLKELAEWAERYTPMIGWQTISELPWKMTDGLLLEVGGTAKVLGGEKHLAQKILRDVQLLGYHPRVAVADTPGAAFAMARYATSVRDPIRHLAARAVPPEDGRTSEDGKPIGALWEGLPIEALRLEADTIALLHRLGVLFCRQLRALPRASLAARLGEHPAIRMAQLTGEIAEWIEPHRPPPEFRESYQLENPTACRRSLDAFIQRLLKQLTEHLRQAGQGAIRLLCRLNSADGGVLDIDVGLFRPTISANHLWDLIEMQLEQAITPAAVRQIVLEVMVSTPLRQKQGELFGGDLRCPRELGGLLERLSSRLGREAVLQVRLRREPLPEETFAEQPAAGQAARNLGGQPAHGPLERPLFFYHPPRPLHVKVMETGDPLRIQWRSKRLGQAWQQVAQCWGPERLETSWWRGPSVRRDYFRIETNSGERFWIFHRLIDNRWFLHGAFG